jgi:hypothetical protein
MAAVLQRHLIAPRTPKNAASFIDDGFAVVDLDRAHRNFTLSSSAVTQLPGGLLVPSFEIRNIADQQELAAIIRQTVEAAGLINRKRWSVALPEGVARSFVIALETKPGSRRELSEMIRWKVERLLGASSSQIRISRQPLNSIKGANRYLVTVAIEEVVAEYETLFADIGWQAGLLLPKHLGEAQWLIWDDSIGDKMLVTVGRTGFTAVIAQKGEVALVRSEVCEGDGLLDELFRMTLYYRDRMMESVETGAGLECVLLLGDIDRPRAMDVICEASGSEPRLLDPAELGFDLKGEPINFDQLAAAAGIATLAWR